MLAQIFSPSADTFLRFALLLTLIAALGLMLVGAGYANSAWQTRAGWAVAQPVPFSHKHHVGDDGLDCRYCHTGVETSADAGLPATQVCMTCHSQLWTGAPVLAPVRASFASGTPIAWQRVAQLPDYVYFDHSIHVARGVGCVECHGRVDQMPLMRRAFAFQMRFCLDCHRDPAPHLRPPDEVTRMEPDGRSEAERLAYGQAVVRRFNIDSERLINCGTCHR